MNIATKLRPAKSRLNRGLNVLGLDDTTKQPYINGLPRKSDEAIAFQIHQAVEVGDGDRSKLDKALEAASIDPSSPQYRTESKTGVIIVFAIAGALVMLIAFGFLLQIGLMPTAAEWHRWIAIVLAVLFGAFLGGLIASRISPPSSTSSAQGKE